MAKVWSLELSEALRLYRLLLPMNECHATGQRCADAPQLERGAGLLLDVTSPEARAKVASSSE
jgi:hypothetical protein